MAPTPSHTLSPQLIDSYNQLEDICAQIKVFNVSTIKFPKIVVIGAQSHGKSSVLESIVGRQFLPRGTGIVTRTPLMLHISRVAEGTVEEKTKSREWAKFVYSHLNKGQEDKIFTDMSQVKKEIERLTEELAGSGDKKTVSDKEIIVYFYTPDFVSLTLVDLPGMVENAADMDPTIVQKTEDLVNNYIKDENTIILVVATATENIENIKALSLARDVDTYGDRTMLVLTKLDLMDPGTDASDLLTGKKAGLPRLGTVGLKNRSQQDINNNKPMADVLKDEKEFFRKNYGQHKGLVDKNGIEFLRNKLSSLLFRKISEALPNMEVALGAEIQNCKVTISELGEPNNGDDIYTTMFRLIQEFVRNLNSAINGTARLEANKIVDGAVVQVLFHGELKSRVAGIDALGGKTAKEIEDMRTNSMGANPHLFTPTHFLWMLLKEPISSLEYPSIDISEQVSKQLRLMVQSSIDRAENSKLRYPRLFNKIAEECGQFITDRLVKTDEMIKTYIQQEVKYINIRHPDMNLYCTANNFGQQTQPSGDVKLRGNQSSLQIIPNKEQIAAVGAELPLSDHTKMQNTEVVQTIQVDDSQNTASMARIYFDNVVVKNLLHIVPQIIWLHLLERVRDDLNEFLFTKLKGNEDLESLFEESDAVKIKREKVNEMLKTFTKATEAIGNIRSGGPIQKGKENSIHK